MLHQTANINLFCAENSFYFLQAVNQMPPIAILLSLRSRTRHWPTLMARITTIYGRLKSEALLEILRPEIQYLKAL